MTVIDVHAHVFPELTRDEGRVLADEGINLQAISTSEIKVSALIDPKYTELAVRALHTAFGLDKPAESTTAG